MRSWHLVHLIWIGVSPLEAQSVRRPAAEAAGAASLSCSTTAEGTPQGVLGRAARAIGLTASRDRLLRVRAWQHAVNDFQSDRAYPPFFSVYQSTEAWLDPRGGGRSSRGRDGAFPNAELGTAPFATLGGPWAAWAVRDTLARPLGSGAEGRALDPWAVVHDFMASRDARLEGRCTYRDYPRLAVSRAGVFGRERLLIDPKTLIPVALLREEPHFLWGQVDAEYVWSNWDPVDGGGLYPLTAFRQLDGELNVGVTVTDQALVPPDSAPRLALPDTAFRAPAQPPMMARPVAPDTVRIGAATWLLVNPAYTITVALLRDTVFVLDATLGEVRARQDALWIERLFPGRHPVVVVVTDLAWPHIAGVRYWVANGATVVSHRASRAFLQRVVERRWTREPDLLEQRRARARLSYRAVDDSLALAGGELVLHAIDGIASEGALMGWVPAHRYLWAGDFIQDLRAPSQYAREVLRAVRRAGVEPERVAAQHVPLTPWRTIDSLHADEPSRAGGDVPDGAILRTGPLARHASAGRAGQGRDLGRRVQELSRAAYHGRPALISVQVFDTPQGPAIDSSIADAATLAPIRHVGVHRSRTLILDFAGRRVTGRYAPEGGPPLPIAQAMGARPFDASLFDLVFAALPLDEGYAARLPFYVYEQGGAPVWYTGSVAGTETLALRDGGSIEAWVVDVSEDGQPRARLWVSRSGEREVVRAVQYIGGGAEYMLTR